jgi:hypothetical protein
VGGVRLTPGTGWEPAKKPVKEQHMMEQEAGRRNLERLRIEELDASEIEEAVEVIVRGMRDNPNNIAAFGRDPEVRHSRLLRLFGAMASAEVPGRDRNMLAARGSDGSILASAGWCRRAGASRASGSSSASCPPCSPSALGAPGAR